MFKNLKISVSTLSMIMVSTNLYASHHEPKEKEAEGYGRSSQRQEFNQDQYTRSGVKDKKSKKLKLKIELEKEKNKGKSIDLEGKRVDAEMLGIQAKSQEEQIKGQVKIKEMDTQEKLKQSETLDNGIHAGASLLKIFGEMILVDRNHTRQANVLNEQLRTQGTYPVTYPVYGQLPQLTHQAFIQTPQLLPSQRMVQGPMLPIQPVSPTPLRQLGAPFLQAGPNTLTHSNNNSLN